MIILLSCNNIEPVFEQYTPAGSYQISWDDLPELRENSSLKLGGFSSLYYKSGREFVAITDRGPVLREENNPDVYFLEPYFTPQLVKFEVQDNGKIKITDRIGLKAPGGNSISGLVPPDLWNGGENMIADQAAMESDEWGMHPGGLVFDQLNNFYWVADHYGPCLYQVTVHGEIVRRLRPYEGLRRSFVTRLPAGGFAGLDMDINGRLIAILSRHLDNARTEDAEVNPSFRRLISFDPTINEDKCMFYPVEPEGFDGLPAEFVRIGDIAALGDTTYFVTEYGSFNDASRSLLFKVSITDSTTQAPTGLEGIAGKTFETLMEEEWEEKNLTFVEKTLIADLSVIGIDNPVAIALLDSKKLAILEDNCYGITNINVAEKSYQLDKKGIKLIVLDLP